MVWQELLEIYHKTLWFESEKNNFDYDITHSEIFDKHKNQKLKFIEEEI